MLIAVGNSCEIEPKTADNILVRCSWSSGCEQASMVSELSNIKTSNLRAQSRSSLESSTLRSCCQESNVGIRFTVKGEREKRSEGGKEGELGHRDKSTVYVRCVTQLLVAVSKTDAAAAPLRAKAHGK